MHGLMGEVGAQVSFLLLVSLLGYLFAAITNQSAVVWQIILGIIIGPTLLNLMQYSGVVANLAYLGAIILLFVVGLEFKANELFNLKSASIAVMGIIVPWVLGYLTAALFGFDNKTAILIGTALTATSIAITANVLYELNYLRTPLANIIIGAAVIDDILALFILTITTTVTSGEYFSVLNIAFLVTKVILFLLGGLLFGYHVINKIITRIDNSAFADKYPEFVFVLTVSVAFLYALIAESLGISAIIGAFISGVFLEGVTLRKSKHFRDGADYLRTIFASIFFVSLGVLADLKQINVTTIWFIIVLIIVAIVSKIVGCSIPAKLSRMSWRNALAVGAGMMPRGEVAMIVALLGLKSQTIGQPIYSSIILMSLVTTIIAPIFLKILLRKREGMLHRPV